MKFINTLIIFIIILISKSIISNFVYYNYHFNVTTICNFTNETVKLYLYDKQYRHKPYLANNSGICGKAYNLTASTKWADFYYLYFLIIHTNHTNHTTSEGTSHEVSQDNIFYAHENCKNERGRNIDYYYNCTETLTNITLKVKDME
uniref:C-type lectin domain-containing protein n=1 Tax=Strongyloides venezuelensis TaxID=75913 RepID=A0A0K0FRG0_STRVS